MKIEIVLDHPLKYLLNEGDINETNKCNGEHNELKFLAADSQGRSGWHHLLQWKVVVNGSKAFYDMVATSTGINVLLSIRKNCNTNVQMVNELALKVGKEVLQFFRSFDAISQKDNKVVPSIVIPSTSIKKYKVKTVVSM
ncbi:hypothetical protein V1477_018906 [Vespula maculifrons]|uniref:Uncharacterized protein n=1 Tax=Vespula maculifrons TaxID=7453 RepID=A0ABD2ASS0_VESMC